jgi:hypothetical protein
MCSSFFAEGAGHLSVRRLGHPARPVCTFAGRCGLREPQRRVRDSAALPPRVGLGAASAGAVRAWALPAPAPSATPAQRLPAGASVLRVPLELLQTMRRVAAAEGRDEAVVWAEAAREWLAGRARDDEPQPPAPAAAALPQPHAAAWAAIDVLLADLRASRRTDHAA